MINDHNNQNVVPAPESARCAEECEVHPVLAEILAEKEPDTISWVKA